MKKKYVIIGVSTAISCFIIALLISNILTIKIVGKSTINIKVFEEYKDPKATACVKSIGKCIDITEKITISNSVNTNKVGKYKVKYKVKYGILNKTATRRVNVVDVTPPTITLKGNKENILCPNKKYIEEGYEVTDNYDKNVKIDIKEKDDKIIYSATDSSNNTSEEIRIVKKEDKESPSIIIDNSAYLVIGSAWNDTYKAVDNCDGDLTNNIKINGKVDTNKEGSYPIEYEVEDSSGNKKTDKKIVYVFRQNNPNNVTDKIIYLTFDDGPGPYTEQLLNILDKYNVKATFFVTNQYGYKNMLKRIYNDGHSLAAHTSSHDYNKIYSSVDAYFKDLDEINNTIYKYTGYKTNLIRFPGGSSNRVSKFNPGIMTTLTKEVENRGYQYFDWNIDSMDTSTNDPYTIANNVIKNLNGGTYVVLQHDIKEGSVNAVEQIIQYGLTNGYTFLPLNVSSYKAHHHVNN